MENLRALGLDQVLRDDVVRAGKPFLGICIGIQVLLDRSEEDEASCLGIVAGRVVCFPAALDGRPLKVPQIQMELRAPDAAPSGLSWCPRQYSFRFRQTPTYPIPRIRRW